ncbi:MAG: TlpA disulfide reductase family protein [Rudaea sp.]
MSAMTVRILLAAALLAAAIAASAVEPGAVAPAFSLPSFASAHPVSLADYRGEVVLVDFWASWCSPCRQSLPLYDKLRGEFSPADFAILAIGLDENVADARSFLAEHQVKYMTLQNPQGDVAKAFGLTGMPSSYLIDRDGIVRARHIGFEPKDIVTLRHQIAVLIAKSAHAS